MKFNKVIISTSIGNALEWYEYLLYAHFSTIISSVFFPSESRYLSMMMTFAVFAVGFLSRPLGAIIFGYIGDKYSRKSALTCSIALIAIPTTIIGLLPSYEKIGLVAPILLIIMRILQGISLGGEFSASLVFLVESAPVKKQGFFGAFSTSSIAFGMIFSSFVIFLLNVCFTAEQIQSFAWRIPFLFSFIIGFIGIYIRKKLKKDIGHFTTKSPIKEVFTTHIKKFIVCFGMFAIGTVLFFFISIILKIIMDVNLGYEKSFIEINNIIIMLVLMISSIIFGIISDFIDPKKILLITATCIAGFIVPFLMIISLHNILFTILASSLLTILLGIYFGVIPAFFANQFPSEIRASAVGLSYNIPVIFFGGTTPIIMNCLIQRFDSIFAISYYIIFACTVSIFAIFGLYKIK